MSTAHDATPRASLPGLPNLIPKRVPVAFGEDVVEVRELTGREIARVHDDLVRVIRSLGGVEKFDVEIGAACAVAEATTSIPRASWEAAPAGALYAVLKAAALANMDFFTLRAEAAAALLAPMETAPAGDGPTSSTSSSPADTTTP